MLFFWKSYFNYFPLLWKFTINKCIFFFFFFFDKFPLIFGSFYDLWTMTYTWEQTPQTADSFPNDWLRTPPSRTSGQETATWARSVCHCSCFSSTGCSRHGDEPGTTQSNHPAYCRCPATRSKGCCHVTRCTSSSSLCLVLQQKFQFKT